MNRRLRSLVLSAEARGVCLMCGSKPCECEKRKTEYEQFLKSLDLGACIEQWRAKRSEVDKIKLK